MPSYCIRGAFVYVPEARLGDPALPLFLVSTCRWPLNHLWIGSLLNRQPNARLCGVAAG